MCRVGVAFESFEYQAYLRKEPLRAIIFPLHVLLSSCSPCQTSISAQAPGAGSGSSACNLIRPQSSCSVMHLAATSSGYSSCKHHLVQPCSKQFDITTWFLYLCCFLRIISCSRSCGPFARMAQMPCHADDAGVLKSASTLLLSGTSCASFIVVGHGLP